LAKESQKHSDGNYMLMKKISLVLILVLSSCSTTRFAQLGPDTYLVMRKAGTGYSSSDGMKMDALEEAAGYCANLNKKLLILTTSQKSVAFASTPSAEIQFRCLNDGDPELVRPNLETAPDTKIEIKQK